MTIFWLVAAILILVALAFVVTPLLRPAAPGPAPTVERIHLSIFRDQLAELEADVESGTLSTDQLEEGRLELERRLLEGMDAASETGQPPGATGRPKLALLLGLAIPAAALFLYLHLGRLDALVTAAPAELEAPAGPIATHSLSDVVQALAERLEAEPEDARGWLMLARSYTFLEEHGKAADAWARVHSLVGDQPDVLASYADALAMANGGRFGERSIRLVERALEIDPHHEKALWLSGTIAYEVGDYPKAIEFWERLVASAPEGSRVARAMAANIAEARALARGEAPGAGAATNTDTGAAGSPPSVR